MSYIQMSHVSHEQAREGFTAHMQAHQHVRSTKKMFLSASNVTTESCNINQTLPHQNAKNHRLILRGK